jgi:hypothetical protein
VFLNILSSVSEIIGGNFCYMTGQIFVCRLLTGSILAHEMMHAWLRLKGAFIFHGICGVKLGAS